MNEFLSPEQIASAAFETKRRGGLDPEGVRDHLRAAADTVAALMDERDGLVAELEAAQTSLASTPEVASVAAPAELDEEALTEQLGQHAARVLAEARAAAADRIAEAEAEADDIRSAAEELHAERSMAADARAQTIRDEAESLRSAREAEAKEAAASIMAAAQRDAEAMQSELSLSRDEVGQDAERIIRDAEVTRRQILEDLARRRTAARRQIEQLRAGRERLMASHETVRRALDEITEELRISMSEARAAAETAGHSVSETTIEELEAEIETARLTGLLDTGPVPVVSSPTPSNKARTSKAIPTSTQPSASSPKLVVEDAGAEDTEATTTPDDTNGPAANDVAGDEAASSPDIGGDDSGEESSDDGTAGEETDGTLAPVVSLDQARSEVETRGHPAAGRDASSVRPKGDEVDEEVVAGVPESDDESDSVGALFASLRSEASVEEDDVDEVEDGDPPSQDTADDDGDAVEANDVEEDIVEDDAVEANDDDVETGDADEEEQPAAQAESAPAIDAAEGARRLKRVLADEQSRVMSTLKGGEGIPTIDELLGTSGDHVDQYWSASGAHLGGGATAPVPVVSFVKEIRRKVSDALVAGDDADTDSVVDSMRSIYREIKTSAVEVCVDGVASGAASAAS